jgi:hypothetical protein
MTDDILPPDLDAQIRSAIARTAAAQAGMPLGYSMQANGDGLYVPSNALLDTQPIDLVQVYLTAEDILGSDLSIEWLVDRFDRLELMDVIGFASHWLARTSSETPYADIDRQFAETYFSQPTRAAVMKLIAEGRRLVLPQALLMMMKIAVVRCGRLPVDQNAVQVLPVMMLATSSRLSGGPNPTDLIGEIVANQHFNKGGSTATRLATYQARWHDPRIADAAGPLANTYKKITGIDLGVLEMVILGIWAHTQASGSTFISLNTFAHVDLPEQEINAALEHISADADTLVSMFEESENITTFNSMHWNFSPFERFPLLRTPDGWCVLHVEFLLNRLTTWTLFFDIQDALKKTDASEAARQDLRFRQVTERYIQSIVARTYALLPGRVFNEDALRTHLGRKYKVADVAIDYGHSWVVLEISTRRLTRDSVHGGGGLTLEDEIAKLVAKARQLDSSIKRIRETAFRGSKHRFGSAPRFFPVLMLTEGYPVNPIILDRLRHVLKLENLLAGQDTAPIELIDTEDLEVIEAVALSGGPSIVDILTSKQLGGMRLAGVTDHMQRVLRLDPPRSPRAKDAAEHVFSRVRAKMRSNAAELEK